MTRKKEDLLCLVATSFVLLIISGLAINSLTGNK